MKLPTEKNAKLLLLVSLFLFLPVFFWVGIGAGIIPLSILSAMGLSSLLTSPSFGALILLQVIIFLLLEYVLAWILIKMIYRINEGVIRGLALLGVITFPAMVSLLPIYTIAGAQDAVGPSNIFGILG